jgi:hypothetical protein
MLLLYTPVHGPRQHGEVAHRVAHPALVVDIFTVAFVDAAELGHLAPGGVALGAALLLRR